MDGSDLTTNFVDLIQMAFDPADSCAISPSGFFSSPQMAIHGYLTKATQQKYIVQ